MKEILALFFAITVAASVTAHGSHGSHGSQGDGGLSVGLESGLHMHQHDDEDEPEVVPNTALALSYSEGFLDDKLEFDIGLSYLSSFKKGYFELEHDHAHDDDEGHDHSHDHDHDIFKHRDFFQQVLCLTSGLTYSLDATYFSTLSFILENETDFYLVPRIDVENSIKGVLKPGIKWNQKLGFGDIYVRYNLPLQYVSYFKEEEFGVGSDVTLGWQSKFGLGIDVIGRFSLSPESGFDGVDAIVTYALSVKKFASYIGCEFEDIGPEIGFAPLIGVRYNF